MIRSEDEYQATHRRLAEAKKNLAVEEKRLSDSGFDEQHRKRLLDPMRSFMLQLEEEMITYERLKRGEVRPLINLREMGRTLVALRIASGLTQRELAKKLQVDESQISRWERNGTMASQSSAHLTYSTRWVRG